MGKYNRRPGFYSNSFLFLLFLLLLAILVFFLYYVINPQQPEITANPTTTQQPQIQLQEQEQRDDILNNPYTAPLVDNRINIRTQGELSEYTPLGILTSNQPPASEAALVKHFAPNPVTNSLRNFNVVESIKEPIDITNNQDKPSEEAEAITEGLAPGYQDNIAGSTSAGSTFPLIGRNINRDNWNYYTIQKLPIYNSNNKNCLNEDGCQLLSDGDNVKIEGTDATFKVTYDNAQVRYLPDVF
jgi:hypothetical protein